MTDPRDALAEAIAWWRLDLPFRRELLSETSANLVAAGDDSPALVELAALYVDEGSYTIDKLLERVVIELDLTPDVTTAPGILAARRMSRLVLDGRLSEREFSRWAHGTFHHDSDDELLNDLALLDDDYDEAVHYSESTDRVEARIRDVAERILRDRP